MFEKEAFVPYRNPSDFVSRSTHDDVPADSRASHYLRSVDARRVIAALVVMTLVVTVSAIGGMRATRAIAGIASNPTPAAPLAGAYDLQQAKEAADAAVCLSAVLDATASSQPASPIELYSIEESASQAKAADAVTLLTDGAEEAGLYVHAIDADEIAMRRELISGRPIIAAMNPGMFGLSPTYITLTDIDEHGKLTASSPRDRSQKTLTPSFEDVIDQSSSLWAYTVANEQP